MAETAGFMVTKHPHNSRGWGFYRIPHNDQAIKHQAATGFLLPVEPEMSPGKKHNYRQIQDIILKATQALRVAGLVIHTDSQYPNLRMAAQTAEPGNTVWAMHD